MNALPDDRQKLMRFAALAANASGAIAAVGVLFLLAMFASFGFGATAQARIFGLVNDISIIGAYSLTAPMVIALHVLVRPRAPAVGVFLAVVAIASISAIVILQLLLVTGTMTYEAQVGLVSIALLVLGLWFVAIGHLANANQVLRHGVIMGVLAATYLGYPIWAFWLARRLARAAS